MTWRLVAISPSAETKKPAPPAMARPPVDRRMNTTPLRTSARWNGVASAGAAGAGGAAAGGGCGAGAGGGSGFGAAALLSTDGDATRGATAATGMAAGAGRGQSHQTAKPPPASVRNNTPAATARPTTKRPLDDRG